MKIAMAAGSSDVHRADQDHCNRFFAVDVALQGMDNLT